MCSVTEGGLFLWMMMTTMTTIPSGMRKRGYARDYKILVLTTVTDNKTITFYAVF